jgi:hypothetical protein
MPQLETFIAAFLCCGEGLFFLPRRLENLKEIRRLLAEKCARTCYNSRKAAFGPGKTPTGQEQTGKEETLC